MASRPIPLRAALKKKRGKLGDLTEADLAAHGTIFQIGIAPNRIDVITSVDALDFGRCYERAFLTTYGGIPIRVLAKEDLITNKKAVGRKQDPDPPKAAGTNENLLDVENLEKGESS